MFKEITVYEVGKYIENTPKKYDECIKFDLTDTGINIPVFFNSPTLDEINEFAEGKIKLGYYTYKNVILVLIKIGNLSWMDMPYSIHLSNHLSAIKDFEEGNGIGLTTTLYLINAQNGILEALRVVGANNRLSVNLIKDIKKQKEMTFEEYDVNLDYIYKTYTTKELINRAKIIENLKIIK